MLGEVVVAHDDKSTCRAVVAFLHLLRMLEC